MRGKNLTQKQGGRKYRTKVRYLVAALAFSICQVVAGGLPVSLKVSAAGCPDVRVVFARGSGGESQTDKNYLAFKSAIESKLATTTINYEIVDLDYPAVGVGFGNIENAMTTIGAYISGGEAFEFGDSMWAGVFALAEMVFNESCPNTKYVLGGYSQGAMVVINALQYFTPERLIYAATFGDPKIYLPEGQGLMPAACSGQNLSDYRMYVPDCQAYMGIMGGYVPYEPAAYTGKVGTWCNKRDILCSSHLSISDHISYIEEGLYEDASRVIFDKICKAFGVENKISSPHDTAILIDATGSMSSMIEEYKAEALRLARETLAADGRVALYDYRDLSDPYEPVEHCNFETCTIEKFEEELALIHADNGGDTPESLLSASFHVMSDLTWKYGSTKSLVVLTDADFLSPDRDGMTFDEVVALSRQIDPVNFYIITNASYGDSYTELAAATDGRVVTNFDELSLLTDYIMERYDSLPRVEEQSTTEERLVLTIEKMDRISYDDGLSNVVRVKFTSTSPRTLVVLNDTIMGVTEENEIMITGLHPKYDNHLALVPLGNDVKGETQDIRIDVVSLEIANDTDITEDGEIKPDDAETPHNERETVGYGSVENAVPTTNGAVIPKAPNTGAR